MPDYELIRSGRKTLALEITKDCRVLVRAPRKLSKARIDDFVSRHAVWISAHLEQQRRRIAAAPPPPTPEEIAALKARAQAVLPQKVAFWSRKMGLIPTGFRVTSARTRYGSCSGKNSLCFSWRLMAYPPEAVDYVVVHELAHITVKNHSRAFYRLVEQYLPDWRKRRELLKG